MMTDVSIYDPQTDEFRGVRQDDIVRLTEAAERGHLQRVVCQNVLTMSLSELRETVKWLQRTRVTTKLAAGAD